ncbi:1-aminocyclopropane-1-carboxylate deaminase [Rhizodiscina lignyota]|uniref:1-aminocyclopropane-1-carboxylate deaminase n=1 Tax=Rhizodiscina lignyota TaxID=1504668 RepID=A0A9P4IL74_9PEZI|nr:1-aminocyclopropane-1-carboxylate deaminase [Rhizodiscina lignyota]
MVKLPPPFSDIPRKQLLFSQPSAVEKLKRLTGSINDGVSFWIKREDCNSGLAFGGNKVRKLEYILQDAIDQGADTLLTTGGLQSNHMRQTTAAAARLGLKVALLPKDAVASDDAEYRRLGNIQLNAIMSAETFPVGTTMEDAEASIRSRGGRPYFIPSGASTHPLGGLGFARWAFELVEQEKSLGVRFDTIVTSVASGSTLGGMVAGFKLAQKTSADSSPRRLIEIQAMTQSLEEIGDLLLSIAQTAAEKIGLKLDDITKDDFEAVGSFHAGAYGRLDDQTSEGIKEFARLEGILTDPVYTGKAITGLLHLAREGEFRGSKNVLFCHTGGQVALSAYPRLS